MSERNAEKDAPCPLAEDGKPGCPEDGGLPDCEGWTCQSCGADNFIPDGFARVTPSDRG